MVSGVRDHNELLVESLVFIKLLLLATITGSCWQQQRTVHTHIRKFTWLPHTSTPSCPAGAPEGSPAPAPCSAAAAGTGVPVASTGLFTKSLRRTGLENSALLGKRSPTAFSACVLLLVVLLFSGNDFSTHAYVYHRTQSYKPTLMVPLSHFHIPLFP